MPNADQLADSIIEEEKLDALPTDDDTTTDSGENTDDEQGNQDEEQNDEGKSEGDGESSNESGDEGEQEENTEGDEGTKEDEEEDTKSDEDESSEPSPSELVERSKSFINDLQKKGLQPYDQNGNVRDFKEVVPEGDYYASHLSPVRVTDKEGKTHEFLLISDVEKKFPDGFEAKNNIEQMKFERALQKNEDSFDKAIADYRQMQSEYAEEVQQHTQTQQTQASIANEYKSMAKMGLVPEVGDSKDPKFNESDAVKELNKLLAFQKKENTDRRKKGVGELTSLYDTKMVMDQKDTGKKKTEKAKNIDQQRKSTASLSRAPSSKGTETKKAKPFVGSTATLAEQIIAEEGLK